MSTTYFIQLGSFADPDNAGRARDQFASVWPVQFIELSGSAGPVYRVRLGPIADQADAVTALDNAQAAGFGDANWCGRRRCRPRCNSRTAGDVHRASPGAVHALVCALTPRIGIVMRRVLAVTRLAGFVCSWLSRFWRRLAVALAQEQAFESKAPQAILIDARTGSVLYEKDADTAIPPASMSKLMTMIMVFEALKAGKLTLDQEFTISEDAWRRGGAASGGSTMYAELNSRVKLPDLIQGVVVQSANDACIAIAEGMAAARRAFAQKMTERARELGATTRDVPQCHGPARPRAPHERARSLDAGALHHHRLSRVL